MIDWLWRIAPWWLLRFINRHTRTCWSEMVSCKLSGDVAERCLRPSASCFNLNHPDPAAWFDYCGRWEVPPVWMPSERAKFLAAAESTTSRPSFGKSRWPSGT